MSYLRKQEKKHKCHSMIIMIRVKLNKFTKDLLTIFIAFAKVKTDLYDLDTFIHKNSNKFINVDKIKVYSGDGFDQK